MKTTKKFSPLLIALLTASTVAKGAIVNLASLPILSQGPSGAGWVTTFDLGGGVPLEFISNAGFSAANPGFFQQPGSTLPSTPFGPGGLPGDVEANFYDDGFTTGTNLFTFNLPEHCGDFALHHTGVYYPNFGFYEPDQTFFLDLQTNGNPLTVTPNDPDFVAQGAFPPTSSSYNIAYAYIDDNYQEVLPNYADGGGLDAEFTGSTFSMDMYQSDAWNNLPGMRLSSADSAWQLDISNIKPLSVVPEPSRAVLLALAGSLLALRRRR